MRFLRAARLNHENHNLSRLRLHILPTKSLLFARALIGSDVPRLQDPLGYDFWRAIPSTTASLSAHWYKAVRQRRVYQEMSHTIGSRLSLQMKKNIFTRWTQGNIGPEQLLISINERLPR
jgi:hypothetical protein